MELTCLHGFLGSASDWDFLRTRWKVKAPSLFEPGTATTGSLEEWAEFWTASLPPERRVLVGYSLGGRLALHALAAAPRLFSGAILISAHPGLPSEAERQARLAADAAWARRFREERWSDVVGAWESQGVFASTTRLPRPEDRYSREKLSHALLGWSLGAQGDVLGQVAERAQAKLGQSIRLCLPVASPPVPPILWLAGERDAKFTALAREAASRLRQMGMSGEYRIIPEAGHRLPWDVPEAFGRIVESFVKERINHGAVESVETIRGHYPRDDARRDREGHDQSATSTQRLPSPDGDGAAGRVQPLPRQQ